MTIQQGICQKCGECCRKMAIEIGCYDIIREPRLVEAAAPFRDTEGECVFDDDGDTLHDSPCHYIVMPCRMLGPDNLCTIYPTRPNVCVGFRPGGSQCLELRKSLRKAARR